MTVSKTRPARRPFTVAILAATVAITIAGCSKDNLTAEQHIQRAKDFRAQGKLKEAQIELLSTLQRDPKNAQAHVLWAQLSMTVGNPFLAEVELKKAREAGVSAESVKVDLAQALLMQGRVEDALKEAIPGDRDSQLNRLRMLDLRTRALLAQGKPEEACKAAGDAFRINPASVVAIHSMARCSAATTKNTDQAEAYLRKALEIDAKDAETWALMGNLFLLKDQINEAADAMGKALQLDPTLNSARYQLVSLYLRQDKLKEAEDLIGVGQKIFATPVLTTLLAQVQYKRKNYDQAQETLAQALRTVKDYMPAVFLNGAVAFAQKNFELAAKELARVLASEPDNIQARNMLASSFHHLRQPAQALETLSPVLEGKLPPDAASFRLAGRINITQGRYDVATRYLERSASLAPKDATARTLLGMGLLQGGNATKAVSELIAASDLDVEDTTPEHLLISHYMAGKNFDQALEVVAKLEKKRPNDPDVYVQRGLALFAKKDLTGARASLEKALALQPAYLPAATGLVRMDFARKDFASAKSRLQSVLAKDKNNAEAMLALANLAAWQHKDAEYVDWLIKATKANENNIKAKQLLIDYYLQNNQAAKAYGLADAMVSAHRDSPDALMLLARVQLAMGEKDNALSSFTKLTTLQPKNPDVFHRQGLLYADAQRWQPARAALNKALELAPNFQPAAEALATLELSQGNGMAALDIARRFQKATPKSNAGLILEADIWLRQRKVKEALPLLHKAYTMKPDAGLLLKLHSAEASQGNFQEADKLLVAWLKANEKDTRVRSYYASSLASQKRYAEAIQEYETVLARNPNNPFSLNDLAWTYSRAGDPRALATAEKAVKLFPGNPGIVDTLGWILVNRNQAKAGLTHLEQAAKLSPDASIHFHLAVALANTGDTARARKELQSLVSTPSDFPEKSEARALLDKLK